MAQSAPTPGTSHRTKLTSARMLRQWQSNVILASTLFAAELFLHRRVPSPSPAVIRVTMVNSTPATARVVVIGSGLAGLTAAIMARESLFKLNIDAAITILEKEERPGGNSMKASSGMSALTPTSGDTPEIYEHDTIISGGKLSNERLVKTLVVRASLLCSCWLCIRTSWRQSARTVCYNSVHSHCRQI